MTKAQINILKKHKNSIYKYDPSPDLLSWSKTVETTWEEIWKIIIKVLDRPKKEEDSACVQKNPKPTDTKTC